MLLIRKKYDGNQKPHQALSKELFAQFDLKGQDLKCTIQTEPAMICSRIGTGMLFFPYEFDNAFVYVYGLFALLIYIYIYIYIYIHI